MQPDIPLGLYQHYKGSFYELIDFARHSETEEWFVVYRPTYGDKGTWIRPLSMFTEHVTHEGEVKPRFHYAGKAD